MIFETHAHLDDEAFDNDRHELISSFVENGVKMAVNIGADMESSVESVRLANKYEYIYAAVGIHPEAVNYLSNDDHLKHLEEMSKDPKVVAIGEIGLDYHYEDTNKELQEKWFVSQLELAHKLNMPVIIHSRDAAKDTLDIMKANHAEQLKGVVHCYSYSKEIAQEFLNMGYYFGIGGVVTFKNAKKLVETVEMLPMDKIVLETDCPYLSPEPFRGKRNTPLNIPYVANKIAEIKNIDVQEVYDITYNNALKLYNLD